VKEAVKKGYSINLIGLSLGNIFAIKVAGDLKRVNNIVSIVRGAKLGSSAWKSALTSVVLGKNGNTMKTYEKGVSSYNPISHVSKINAKKVLIRLGAMDKLIPFEEGKKLAEAFLKRAKKSNLIVDYKVFKLADHCSAMFFYSLECIVKKYINRRKDC
jgi:hypothetical protein